MQGIFLDMTLLDGSEMINNHFVDGSLLLVHLDQGSVGAIRGCSDTFYSAYGVVVNEWKT